MVWQKLVIEEQQCALEYAMMKLAGDADRHGLTEALDKTCESFFVVSNVEVLRSLTHLEVCMCIQDLCINRCC